MRTINSTVTVLFISLLLGLPSPVKSVDMSPFEKEIEQRLLNAEWAPPRVENPPHSIVFCKSSSGSFKPIVSFGIGGRSYICENTPEGRAIIRWRAWICQDDRNCTLSRWTANGPSNGQIQEYTETLDYGGGMLLKISAPRWQNSAQLSADDMVRAIANNDFEALKAHLTPISDLNLPNTAGDQTPLFAAAFNGRLEMVDYLVKKGAEVNSRGMPALYAASNQGHLAVVDYLLRAGADFTIEHKAFSSLGTAARHGYLDVVKRLLQEDIDPSYRGHALGLIGAAQNGHLDVVKHLVNVGFDPNFNQANGTALYFAVLKSHTPVMNYLLSVGADINGTGALGRTALHAAGISGSIERTTTLLNNGALIDAIDAKGYTPLMFAAQKGWKKTTEILLERGADKSIKGPKKVTARKLAKRAKHKEIARMLK